MTSKVMGKGNKAKKVVSMSKKEIALALTVLCPKCRRFPGKQCKNTKTGDMKEIPHELRLKLAQNPPDKMFADANGDTRPQFKPDPKAKLTSEQKEVVNVLTEKIHGLGKNAEFIGPVSVGPVLSTYRFIPQRRTRVAHIEAMSKDFAAALGAEAILAKRMPGETAVGIFVPNKERKLINFRDMIEHVQEYYNKHKTAKHTPIPVLLGEDELGYPVIDDLTQMPHLLVAGTTGGGKSTLLHAIVAGLTYTMPPEELKIIISDTKGYEFKQFANVPHLQAPIAKDIYTTMQLLNWAIQETKRRMDLIGTVDARKLSEYNALVEKAQRIPYVVLVIDELADLMGDTVDRDEAKLNSQKLGIIVQRARAAGIYVIASTQRPDVRTVKGTIKANFPARITFRLPSQIDSRTIIGQKGAEHLMSQGDMLFYSNRRSDLLRVHAPYTSIEDVLACVQYAAFVHEQKQVKETPATEGEGNATIN